MKKFLFTCSLFLITGLAADEESNIAQLQKRSWSENESATVQECPAPKPCCKEKCCPCPKPPVCCECFVPSYYDLQCDSGVFAYGDFLYWYAKEDNLSPCATAINVGNAVSGSGVTTTTVLAPQQANHLNTKWDPGFRVALGYNFDHDGWDFEVNYTWYQNKKTHVYSVPGFGSTTFPFSPSASQLALVDPWINTDILVDFSAGSSFSFVFDTVNSRWKLTFNQIDLDLGRKYWLGKFTAMRPYVGVRGGWFTTRFNNVASLNTNFSADFTFTKFSDNFKNNIWGVGFLAGIQPEWHFCQNFILFSNIDAALLWGKNRSRKKEDYTSFAATGVQEINYHNIFNSSYYKMQAILDLAIGLRWEETWCYRIRTALDIGWEHHIWFDVNNRIKITTPSTAFVSSPQSITTLFIGYDELQGNLMMGGLVVRFRADF